MNTKKKIGIALAVLMVAAALAAPATASYAGDKPLVTYANGPLKDGGIVYETVEDGSAYTKLPCQVYANDTEQDLIQTINIAGIPVGATVKMARLYNYVTYSTCDNDTKYTSGVPAEAELTFSDGTSTWAKTCVHGYADAEIANVPNPIYYGTDAVQYWDTKGPDYDCGAKYDYPSGTFAWDVTDMVTGNGVYTAKIVNADSTPTGMRPGKPYSTVNYRERFVTYGFGLLVVYEYQTAPVTGKYWIDEGCDLLYNTSLYGVSEPVATTYAPFTEGIGGIPHTDTVELTTVVTASDKWNTTDWDKSENMIYFNGLTPAERIGPSTAQDYYSIGVNDFALTLSFLQPSRNFVYFQDIDISSAPYPGKGDNEVVSNAFLVVEWN